MSTFFFPKLLCIWSFSILKVNITPLAEYFGKRSITPIRIRLRFSKTGGNLSGYSQYMWIKLKTKPDRTDITSRNIWAGTFDKRYNSTAKAAKTRTSEAGTSSKWAYLTDIQQPKIKASVLKYNMLYQNCV